VATQTRAPTSDIAENGTWSGASAGTRYTAVDDHPDSGGADALVHGTTVGNITFGMAAFSIPAGSTITKVDVNYYDSKNGAGGVLLSSRVRVNGTAYNASTHDAVNGGITLRTDTWTTNPETSVAWTDTDINGTSAHPLQGFGFRATDATPTINFWSVEIVVTYTPNVDATLDAQLGGLSSSATSTVEHSATLDGALGSLSGSSSATVEHSATLAAALGALAGAATMTPEVLAALAAALGSESNAAVFTVEHPATLAAPAGGLAGAATFSVEHVATLAAPFGGLVGLAAALVEHLATMASQFGAKFDGQLAATTDKTGVVLAAVLDALSAGATFDVEHLAALDAALGALDATGTFVIPGTAILDAPLGGLVAAMSAYSSASTAKIERVPGPLNTLLDFNPRRRRAQLFDQVTVALTITDSAGAIDLSAALLLEFAFEKPSGAQLVRRATAGLALGRVEYRFAPNELDEAGDWACQARAVLAGGGDVRTPERPFFVGWNLPTV